MSGVSGAAGQIIVNFLYKGSYEAPTLWNDELLMKDGGAESLRCSFDVLATAKKYDIGSLATLAQEYIESWTDQLEPAKALVAIKKACSLPDAKDEWLRNHTKTLLSATYTNIEAFLASAIMTAEHAESAISITEMMLRTVISSIMERQIEKQKEREAAREVKETSPATEQELRAEIEVIEAKKANRGGYLLKKDRIGLQKSWLS
ncbi:hypothetical protein Micbo1qcDRAFT_181188 [Microdochium bolleyi]|uniref:BTB domain-containing protein n=1 Tax=Microdochium bolleyi TaxID=196109 RepID=A0A136IJR5_9PEZI|nr:hypothetical protein Micbo1qcDRAFT_181188 [Microdochium bolleyi]